MASDGAWHVTAGMVRAHLWRTILIAVAASLLPLIGAFGAGYWFRGDQQLVAGVSAGQQECHEQQGGTICFIPVWAKLPPANPTESQNHQANRQFSLGPTRECFVMSGDLTVRGGWGGS